MVWLLSRKFSMNITPLTWLFQLDGFFMHPDEARRERPYCWRRLVLTWLAVFSISGLSTVSGDVRSLDGTIKFDSNNNGVPEAVLNSTGFGLGTITPSANLHVDGNSIVSGTLVVGGTSNASGSNLHINGSWGLSVETVTGNTTLSGNSVVLADASAGNISLTLPAASTVSGRVYTVKKTGNSHTLLLGSATLIDGLPGIELSSSSSAYPYVQVMSDGITWRVLNRSREGTVSSANVYIIVDVSEGSTATSYPVTVANLSNVDLIGADNVQYKTNKIVLRYIPSGNFTMGSPEGELGRTTYEAQHSVTLTSGFFMGVFEVTQTQYQAVMGTNPSGYSGNTRPVERVTWNTVRGGAWASPSGGSPEANSFIGKLRSKAGLSGFDLPTEAQWEYACRAGTTTALNSGVNLTSTTQDAAMDVVGRYGYNNGHLGGTADGKGGYSLKHTAVGSYAANTWGLYDMHGNVWEWCLDWWQPNLGTVAVLDPAGGTSGASRDMRGGSWAYPADYCRAATRGARDPAVEFNEVGFRLVISRL